MGSNGSSRNAEGDPLESHGPSWGRFGKPGEVEKEEKGKKNSFFSISFSSFSFVFIYQLVEEVKKLSPPGQD